MADGLDLSAYADRKVTVLSNPTRLGKAASVNSAVAQASGELILCIDADTTIEPNGLVVMEDLLHGEIRIVIPTLHPSKTTTWIEKNRADWYLKVSKKGRSPGVVGCAFLTSKEFLTTRPLPTETLVEDQHLAWLMRKQRLSVFQSAFTHAYTREPSGFKNLFRQLVRWSYGTNQLEIIKAKANWYIPIGQLGIWLVAILWGVFVYGPTGLLFPVVLFAVAMFMFLPGEKPTLRSIPYIATYLLANTYASLLLIRRRRAKW